MPKGPRGEKRPVSPVSSMVRAMEVATGIEEEQYVDGVSRKPHVPAETSSEDELEGDHMQIAAMRIVDPTERTKPKKRKKKRKKKT